MLKKSSRKKSVKKKKSTEIAIISPNKELEVVKPAAPEKDITKLSIWGKLTPSKREHLKEDVNQLVIAMDVHRKSGLVMGKHIRNIYLTCEPYSGEFRRLVASINIEERQAYRYKTTYENVESVFPEIILNTAVERGMPILSANKNQPIGKYTAVVRLHPPPKNTDKEGAKKYLDDLEATYKQRKRFLVNNGHEEKVIPILVKSKALLLKENFRSSKNAVKQLSGRQRLSFLEDLVGYLLTTIGITSPTTFSPIAVPEGFRQGPGRPRSIDE